MAFDWIKMRSDLADDPDVIVISTDCDICQDTVVGKLHRLWSWADKHTTDGNALSVTDAFIDRYVGVTGFACAMVKVGWLEVVEGGVNIPNFERHNGKSAKKRALGAKRQAEFRQKSNAPSVTNASPTQHNTTQDNNNIYIGDTVREDFGKRLVNRYKGWRNYNEAVKHARNAIALLISSPECENETDAILYLEERQSIYDGLVSVRYRMNAESWFSGGYTFDEGVLREKRHSDTIKNETPQEAARRLKTASRKTTKKGGKK